MSTWTRTYRPVEGERVDGVVTHVLGRRDSRGGHYFGVTNLEVYEVEIIGLNEASGTFHARLSGNLPSH